MFYMLSAYVAFLVGSSEKLSISLTLLVPIGFVVGYVLDRLTSVAEYWQQDRVGLYRTIILRYAIFLVVSALFVGVGILYAKWL